MLHSQQKFFRKHVFRDFMRRQFFPFLVLSILLIFSDLLFAKPKKPDWVKSQRSNPEYYQGVGYAPKVRRSKAHIAEAEKMALQALAAEISVEIKASTLFIRYEEGDALEEDFSSVIDARVQSDIEGCERVETYETCKEYWVLYRLSKKKYAEQQAEKRNLAVAQAQAFFVAAERAQTAGDLRTAVVQYVKSLDAVKVYFNENITISSNGVQVNLLTEAYDRINEILTGITIQPMMNLPLQAIYGETLSADKLQVFVRHGENIVSNFPMLITYSERAQRFAKNTDKSGRVGVQLKIKSRNNQETIKFCVDYDRLLQESASDYVIRKWLRQIPVIEKTVYLNIVKPSICITSVEKNIGAQHADLPIKRMLVRRFENASYLIVSQLSDADFELRISAETRGDNEIGGVYTSCLNAKIVVLNIKNGQIVYSGTLDDVCGKQLSYSKAGEKAYEEAVKTVEKRIFYEIQQAIAR